MKLRVLCVAGLAVWTALIAGGMFSARTGTSAPSPGVTGGATTLFIDPQSKEVPLAGGTFTVGVAVSAIENLGAYDFTLTFDPAILEYVSVEDAGFLTNTGRQRICLPPAPFDPLTAADNANATGAIHMGCVTFGLIEEGKGTRGPDGGGVLATVTFRPRVAGVSPLTFVGLSDGVPHEIRPPVDLPEGPVPGQYGFTGLASVEVCDGIRGCGPIDVDFTAVDGSITVMGSSTGTRTSTGDGTTATATPTPTEAVSPTSTPTETAAPTEPPTGTPTATSTPTSTSTASATALSTNTPPATPSAAADPCADVTRDGRVGISDVLRIARRLGSRQQRYDINRDGIVDADDLAIVVRQLGSGC